MEADVDIGTLLILEWKDLIRMSDIADIKADVDAHLCIWEGEYEKKEEKTGWKLERKRKKERENEDKWVKKNTRKGQKWMQKVTFGKVGGNGEIWFSECA